jgi:hypothetical protein
MGAASLSRVLAIFVVIERSVHGADADSIA